MQVEHDEPSKVEEEACHIELSQEATPWAFTQREQ